MIAIADNIQSLGVGGIFAILVIREVLPYLKSKKSDYCDPRKQYANIEKMCRQVRELWEWHNVMDGDGVRVWYVRRSLEEAIEKLATAIDRQNEVFHDMHRDIAEIRKRHSA